MPKFHKPRESENVDEAFREKFSSRQNWSTLAWRARLDEKRESCPCDRALLPAKEMCLEYCVSGGGSRPAGGGNHVLSLLGLFYSLSTASDDYDDEHYYFYRACASFALALTFITIKQPAAETIGWHTSKSARTHHRLHALKGLINCRLLFEHALSVIQSEGLVVAFNE